jgi:hypothetical protein
VKWYEKPQPPWLASGLKFEARHFTILRRFNNSNKQKKFYFSAGNHELLEIDVIHSGQKPSISKVGGKK